MTKESEKKMVAKEPSYRDKMKEKVAKAKAKTVTVKFSEVKKKK
jgi:hypothetical protein